MLSIQACPTTVVIHLGSGFIRPSREQVVTACHISVGRHSLRTSELSQCCGHFTQVLCFPSGVTIIVKEKSHHLLRGTSDFELPFNDNADKLILAHAPADAQTMGLSRCSLHSTTPNVLATKSYCGTQSVLGVAI